MLLFLFCSGPFGRRDVLQCWSIVIEKSLDLAVNLGLQAADVAGIMSVMTAAVIRMD